MKRISIFFLSTLLLAACTQEEINPNEPHEATIRITTSDLNTRVAINGDKFEANDRITISVYDLNNNPYSTNNDNSNWYWYTYNGKTWDGNKEVKLSEEKAIIYAVYPTCDSGLKNGCFVYIGTSAATAQPSQQEYLYASTQGHNYENPTVNLHFQYALAMVSVNILKGQQNANDDITVSTATLKNAENCTNIAIRGNMKMPSGNIVKSESNQDEITLYVNQKLSTTTPVTTNFLVIPTETSDGVILSLFINGRERQVRIPSTTWEKGKRYIYNVTVEGEMEKYLTISEATITPREKTTMETLAINAEVLPIGGTIGTPVDLGLSVKWADHNVGASTESEVGGMYMWGDPTGTATTSTYSNPGLEEISGTQYDIATTQWGSHWRLPTRDEIIELINNTSYVWTSRNGVFGGLFTSKKTGYTNNSIFIPYYGAYWTDSKIKVGDVWTGTRWASKSSTAFILTFDEEKVYSNHGVEVTYKRPVRPVCE